MVLPPVSTNRQFSLPCFHGNWCGPGCGNGKPIDAVDQCCKTHDECYDDRGYWNCNCDRELVACIKNQPFFGGPDGAAMAVLFDALSAKCKCPSREIKCRGMCVKPCGPGKILDRDCRCVCPRVNCVSPKVMDPVTCRCECPPVLCPTNGRVNPDTCRCEYRPRTPPPDPGIHPPPCDAPEPHYKVINGICVPSCGVAASHAGGPPGRCSLQAGDTTTCAGRVLLPTHDCPICCTT